MDGNGVDVALMEGLPSRSSSGWFLVAGRNAIPLEDDGGARAWDTRPSRPGRTPTGIASWPPPEAAPTAAPAAPPAGAAQTRAAPLPRLRRRRLAGMATRQLAHRSWRAMMARLLVHHRECSAGQNIEGGTLAAFEDYWHCGGARTALEGIEDLLLHW